MKGRTFMLTAVCGVAALLAPSAIPLYEAEPLPNPSSEVQHIVLVRHGECLFNIPDEKGIYYTSGKSNHIPLTEKGKKQACQLAQQLRDKIAHGEKVVICSSTAT